MSLFIKKKSLSFLGGVLGLASSASETKPCPARSGLLVSLSLYIHRLVVVVLVVVVL